MTWTHATISDLPDDPFLRYAALPDSLAVTSPVGWAVLLRWRPHGHWGGAAIVADDAPAESESEAFAALAELAADQGISIEWFSTAPGRQLAMPAGLTETGNGRWAFMWTETVPETTTPATFVELDDRRHAATIESFGRANSDDFEGFPGRGFATLWLSTRDEQDLAAVGGLHELGSGAPHLAGIAVRRDVRRAGIGTAITVELTRRAIAQGGVSTLAVNSDNTGAIRLYERLGYRLEHHFHTRSVA